MQIIVVGLAAGALYTLLSLGLIVIFRSSGAVNFAHCGIALTSAYLYFELRSTGTSTLAAIAIALVSGLSLGLVIYGLVMRPLAAASSLTKGLATLAVLVVLESAITLRYTSSTQISPPFLPSGLVSIFGTTLPTADLIVLVFSIGLTAALWAIYRYSSFGRATSGVAENEFAMSLLGHSIRRVAALNWAVGGLLAAIAGVLIGPVLELSPDESTSLLIPTLAVALCGRFRSFGVALVGGLLIGAAQAELTSLSSSTSFFAAVPGLSEAFPFLVIVGVLMIRGDSLPRRDFVAALLPRVGTAVTSRLWMVVWVVLAVVLISSLSDDWVAAVTTSLIAAVLLLSLVVLTGYAGQLSLAQVSIGGVGVFVASKLVATWSWPMPVAALVGVVVSAPIALLFGLPALRTRGVTLAVVTLGLADALNAVLFTRSDVNENGSGLNVGDANLFGFHIDELDHPRLYSFFALIVLAAVAVAVANLRRSVIGKILVGVRGNERAAASLGVSVRGAKLYAFVLSGCIATIAGILGAWRQPNVIMSGNYDPFQSLNAAVEAALGGIGYVSGAIVAGLGAQPGGVVGTVVTNIGLGTWLPIITGGLLLVNIVFNPDGVVPNTMALIRLRNRRLSAAVRASRLGQLRMRPPMTAGFAAELGVASRLNFRDAQPRDSLVISGVTVRFGTTVALENMDLTCRGGEVLGIIGPNGSGKTTLIDAATGYVTGKGSIRLNGRELNTLPAHARSRLGVSRSFQSLELFEDLSVADNLLVAAQRVNRFQWLSSLAWVRRPRLSPTAAAAVADFGLTEDLDRFPRDLPYGRRRLLAICRALAASPRILFLDEPAAGLGEADRAELRHLLRRVAEEWGVAVILVEHDVDLVMEVSDRVVALEFGHVIAEGPPHQVRNDEHVIASYLGRHEEDPEAKRTSRTRFAGASVDVLDATNLTAGYAEAAAINSIDLHAQAGELIALLGANGAGKTTTLLAMCGAVRATRGDVTINGKNQNRRPIHRRVRDGLALMPEQRAIFSGLSVSDNLRLGRGDPRRALDLFPELTPKLKVRAGLLSGGEQQMLSLARILAAEPLIVLADELSLGLAPKVVQRLWQALAEAAGHGAAVMVVEQHVRTALEWTDRAYVMRRGKVELTAPSEDLLQRFADVQELYL